MKLIRRRCKTRITLFKIVDENTAQSDGKTFYNFHRKIPFRVLAIFTVTAHAFFDAGTLYTSEVHA